MQEKINELLEALFYGEGLKILNLLNIKDSISLTVIAKQLDIKNLRFVFDSINRLEKNGLVKSNKIGKERVVKITNHGEYLLEKIKEIENFI